MAIDMSMFHQTFFEESLEGVSIMETELLHMEKIIPYDDSNEHFDIDRESLNTIFRVIHSIKGGSSTFGFGWIADFSHSLESLLDELRDGRLAMSRKIVDVLIHSIDSLRSLITGARTNASLDDGLVKTIQTTLDDVQAIRDQQGTVLDAGTKTGRSGTNTGNGWRIRFRPHAHLLRTGNDPMRIFKELATLGELTVTADCKGLPAWQDYDPESSYLSWQLELRGMIDKQALDEAFDWVTGDCDLEISAIEPEHHNDQKEIREGTQDAGAFEVTERASSIRVSTRKVDALVDIVGELVITKTMLNELAVNFKVDDLSSLLSGLKQLERNTRDLQDSIMSIRMLPIGFVFNRLPRLVRDISQKLGKRVELKIKGERTELDKTVIERISDPLMHLVRNCVDHGIESPESRVAAGKPEMGVIHLDAYQMSGNVIVEITDDGQGLQREKIVAKAIKSGLVAADTKLSAEQIDEFIFTPGISTVDTVSDISGRGVGMDVVRSNIRSLGGGIEVQSRPNGGTKFKIHLPLTLAIVDGLSLDIGEQTYIIPLMSVVESIRISNEDISRPAGGSELFALRKEYLPLIRLYDLFEVKPRYTDIHKGILVIVEAEGKKAGLFVDDLLGQQQVVIKTLEAHCEHIDGVSAATILGNGSVALILDVAALIRLAHTRAQSSNAITDNLLISAKQQQAGSGPSLRG